MKEYRIELRGTEWCVVDVLFGIEMFFHANKCVCFAWISCH